MPEYKWNVLILTTIGMFMLSLDGSILNIAIPVLMVDLAAPFEVSQWLSIIFLLVMAITLIGFGRLADLRGKRKFFLTGLIIFTVGSFLSAIAITGEQLIVFRAIQAIGASLIAATAIAMITEIFPKQETGKALGINVAGIYLGLVLGPILGGVLVQALTWRSIFYLNVPIGIGLIILSYLKVKQSEVIVREEKFDYLGTLTFGLFLATILTTLTFGNRLGWTSWLIILLLVISAIGFVAFIYVERRAQFPMLNLDLFRKNRIFATANAAALLNYVATMGVTFLLSIYLQTFLKYPPLIAGFFLFPTSAFMAGISPIAGRLSDKIGTRYLCALGMGIMALGVGILIAILSISIIPIEWILLSQAVLGLGYGIFSSPNQSAIMKSVEKRDLGIASGTLSTMRVTGQSVSIALLSAVLSIFILPHVLNQILTHQYVGDPSLIQAQFEAGLIAAFWVTIGICLIGVVLSLSRGKETTFILPMKGNTHSF